MKRNQIVLEVNEKRCINCRACETACKQENGIEKGVHLVAIRETEIRKNGVLNTSFSIQRCHHCKEPVCQSVCLQAAISKRSEDGIVLVDQNKCTGCRRCLKECPYEVPQFGQDGIMQKCTFCVHRFNEGLGRTACEEACPAEAIHTVLA